MVKLVAREALSLPRPLDAPDGPIIETPQPPHLRSGERQAPEAPPRNRRNGNGQQRPPKRDALSKGIETKYQEQRDGDHQRGRSRQVLHTEMRQSRLQFLQSAFILDQHLMSSHAIIIR